MVEKILTSQLRRSPSTDARYPLRPSILHQFEQDLTQIILRSDTPQVALSGLLSALGEILLGESCVLGVYSYENRLTQALEWSLGNAGSTVPEPKRLLQLLEFPSLQAQLAAVELLVISDLQTELSLPPSTQNSTRSAGSASRKAKATPPSTAACPEPEFAGVAALLVAKTQFQGRNNGVLILARSQPHQWTELEVQLLKTLSDQMAIAISQSQLEQQVQQQVRYQSLLDHLTSAVRNAWDLDQIFQLAVEGLVPCLQVSQGSVLLLKYADPQLKVRNAEVIPRARAIVECIYPSTVDSAYLDEAESELTSWLKHTFQVSDCTLCQRLLVQAPQPVVIPLLKPASETEADSWMVDTNAAIAALFDLNVMPTLLMLPLENQGTVLGFLALQHTQTRSWQPEEIAFAKLVAAQLSTAIIQTQTLRQVQSLVDERTAQLRRSLDVQAKLYEKTRQQVDQLRRLNQVMEEFLSTVSHELLTPLTSMKLAIRMLREANLSPEQQERYLTILENQCTQETRLINDLLALQKVETNAAPIQLQQIDLKYVVRDLRESWIDLLAERQMNLELDVPARSLLVRTDPESLHRILTELLTNAKKYSDTGSTIYLKVASETNPSNPRVVLSVQNTGSGIAPDEMPIIFEKFRRGRGATQKAIPGIGLGLALVQGLAVHLNGAIAAFSDPIEGTDSWQTCFTVTLPQSPELVS